MMDELMPSAIAEAFSDYCAMGPERSLRDLYQQYRARGPEDPKPPTRRLRTLAHWSTRYSWQQRVSFMTAELAIGVRDAAYERLLEAVDTATSTLASMLQATKPLIVAGRVVEVPDNSIRLKAATTILDLAGLSPALAINHRHIVTGADGGPIQAAVLAVDVSGMSSEELLRCLLDQAMSQRSS